jgi:hypothetical protein
MIYKNKKDGFKEIQKRAIRHTLPIVGLAMIFGLGISYSNQESRQFNTLPFVLLFGIGAGGFGIYRGIQRQKLIFESYVLTIDEDMIKREQLNTPIVRIAKNEINNILRHQNGGLIIQGRNKTDVIIVSNQIENYAALMDELNQIIEIKFQPQKSTLDKLRIPILFGVLVLMAIVFIATNKYLVLTSGTILTVGLTWSFYEIQTSKNVDSKTKRSSWWTILVIISVIGTTAFKVLG